MAKPTNGTSKDDTYTGKGAVEQLSLDQENMAGDIATLQKQHEHIAYAKKMCDTINESDSLKAVIKGLVWQAIRDRIVWIIIGAFTFVAVIFIKEYITELAHYAVEATASPTTTQVKP